MRFDLHKAMFVLPNLFTVSSIFCGFYSIALATGDAEPIHLYRAAIAIFFAIFFDMFDGRVARLTKTQSDFGVQLDSLADLISFGCAPGILLYRWSLSELGFVGLAIAFVYVACGAIRLARFNVLAAREPGSSKYFLGLPIPLAAGTIVSLVLSSYALGYPNIEAMGAAVTAVVLAGLMVSNVRYRTFKDLKLSKKSITLAFMAALLFTIVSTRVKPAVALAVFFLGYIALGLVEGVLFFGARARDRTFLQSDSGVEPDEGEIEELEDDFLASTKED